MIVTIDGPAGSGKSTVGRKLAASLEIPYLDTGAMYRALALTAIQQGIDRSDGRAISAMASSVTIEMDCGPTFCRVRVDGHDVTEAIRTLEVSSASSRVARHQAVRELLVAHQRAVGRSLGSFVADGRDQGSVVFPAADAKFVLLASAQRRAERRLQELIADGQDVDLATVLADIEARDAIDAKQWEPLLKAGAATVLDTTSLSIQQVLAEILVVLDRH